MPSRPRARVQAVADITLEGSCVKPDKALCDAQCAQHATGWTDADGNPETTCLTECEKESEQIATAVAHALASIEVTDEADCYALTDNGSTYFSDIIHEVRRPRFSGILSLVVLADCARSASACHGCLCQMAVILACAVCYQ